MADMPENLVEFLAKLKETLPKDAAAAAVEPPINTGFLDDMKKATELVARQQQGKDPK